jgi:hypothetical protein
MKIVGYLSEENDKLYDFDTLRRLIGTSKSKLHRDLHKIQHCEFVKYKNQFLYTERTMFEIMEKVLFEKLDKIQNEHYELSNDKKH